MKHFVAFIRETYAFIMVVRSKHIQHNRNRLYLKLLHKTNFRINIKNLLICLYDQRSRDMAQLVNVFFNVFLKNSRAYSLRF